MGARHAALAQGLLESSALLGRDQTAKRQEARRIEQRLGCPRACRLSAAIARRSRHKAAPSDAGPVSRITLSRSPRRIWVAVLAKDSSTGPT